MADGSRSGLAAAAIIAAISLFQLALVAAVLEPRAFFSGDPGVKYLQAHALASSGWRSTAVPTHGDRFDPHGRFSMLAGNQFRRATPGAPAYGAYSVLFTLPVSLLLAWGGANAIYLLPILATTATMLLTYRLALPGAGRFAWLAPLLAGLASPLLFYSVDLWEHTLSVCLSTAAVWLAIGASEHGAPRRFAAAGLALGAAIAVREELVAMAAATLVLLVVVPRGRRLAAAAAMTAGAALCVLPAAVLRWSQTGLPARGPAMRMLGILPPRSRPVAVGERVTAMLVPVSAAARASLVGLLAARAARPAVAPPWRFALLGLLCAGTVAWAAADALLLLWRWGRPVALVSAFPAVLALLLVPPGWHGADGARRRLRLLLAVAGTFAAVIWLSGQASGATAGGSQWGPRFLLPAVPMIAAAVAIVAAHARAWVDARATRLVVLTVVALTLCSVAIQFQGLRDLRRTKQQYALLLDALAAVAPGELIVTDVAWVSAVAAVVAAERPLLQVNGARTGTLAELLDALAARGVRRLTFVAGPDSGQRIRDELTEAGWRAGPRTSVPLWIELGVTPYSM